MDCVIVKTPFADVRTIELDGETWCSAADIAGMFQYKKPKNACEILCRNLRSVHLKFPNGKMITRAFVNWEDFMTLADHAECSFRNEMYMFFKNKIYKVKDTSSKEVEVPVAKKEEPATQKEEQNPEIQIWNHNDFGQIRTVMMDGEPWFIAKDVCDILELTNPTMAMRSLEQFERAKLNLGRQGETNIINESGFYALVLKSRKPVAKAFRVWVTSEVLPSIRKHGGYIAGQETLTDEQLLAKALLMADSKIKERDALIAKQNVQIAQQNNLIEGQASYIKEVKPKEEFYDAVAESDGALSMSEMAKFLTQNGIDIGRNRLFEWMVENNYLTKKQNRYEPKQMAMANGYFKLVEYYVQGYYGGNRIQYTVKVTPKGQQHFMKKLLKQSA